MHPTYKKVLRDVVAAMVVTALAILFGRYVGIWPASVVVAVGCLFLILLEGLHRLIWQSLRGWYERVKGNTAQDL